MRGKDKGTLKRIYFARFSLNINISLNLDFLTNLSLTGTKNVLKTYVSSLSVSKQSLTSTVVVNLLIRVTASFVARTNRLFTDTFS